MTEPILVQIISDNTSAYIFHAFLKYTDAKYSHEIPDFMTFFDKFVPFWYCRLLKPLAWKGLTNKWLFRLGSESCVSTFAQ